MSRVFYQPDSLHSALKYRRDSKSSNLLAGGTDLIVQTRKGKGPEGDIIDLSKIVELKEIKILGNEISIGAMATYSNILDSEILHKSADILCQAAQTVGSPQIRNRATIGGNICNASPAADMLPPLVCLEAVLELQSMDSLYAINTRRIALEDFIIGANKTSLKANEILTNIIFTIPPVDSKMLFQKIGRRNALIIARLNGACILNVENNIISRAAFVIGSVASIPKRLSTIEAYLCGKELNEEVLKKAGALASDYVFEHTSTRSSSTYKVPVASRFTAALIENTLKKGEQAYE